MSTANYFGIQGKTAFIFVVVFVVITLPVNFFIYKNVSRLLEEADTQELRAEGERLFGQVRIDPQTLPIPSLKYSMFLRLVSNNKTDSLFASPNFPIDRLAVTLLPVDEWDTLKIITLSRTVPYSDSRLVFSLARSNQQLAQQLLELRYYLFLANTLSIFIAGALVFFVSGYTLRPIRNIINVAQNINAAKSFGRVPVPKSKDENRQLALTINEMLTRLENSIQNQTNFFAAAAHELRTPLTVMKAELTMVNDENRWHEVLHEVERLERTVDDFLMISQLKSESLVIRKKEVDIHELLYVAIKKVSYFLSERKSKVQVLLENDIPGNMRVDEDKIEMVLVNLLANAIKYSPKQSVITVKIDSIHNTKIEIRNPIQHPLKDVQLFKREFVKAEAFSSGLGMGLWIADEIIRLHHGKLELRTSGLEFFVTVIFSAQG